MNNIFIYLFLYRYIFIYNVIIIYGRSGIIKLHSVGSLLFVRPKTRRWGSSGRATLQSGILPFHKVMSRYEQL